MIYSVIRKRHQGALRSFRRSGEALPANDREKEQLLILFFKFTSPSNDELLRLSQLDTSVFSQNLPSLTYWPLYPRQASKDIRASEHITV